MDKTIEQKIIKDIKVKIAGFLYKCQNQSIASGYMGLHTQDYADLLLQNMKLDKLQRKYVKPACEEMIAGGHIASKKE